MADRWYVARDRKKYGPYALAQLKQLAASGKIQPSDMVLAEGTQQWKPARDIRGLFDEAPKTSNPPHACPLPPDSPPAAASLSTTAAQAATPRPPWWKKALNEVRETASATWGQTVRLVNYGRGLWRKRSLNAASLVAQRTLGQRMFEAGAGDPQLRSQIVALDEKLRQAEARKESTRPLKGEREKLVLQLAGAALAQQGALPGVEAEHAKAKETEAEAQGQAVAVTSARTGLPPKDRTTLRRVLIGFGTAGGVGLLAVCLLCSGVSSFFGIRGTPRSDVPEFSGVDFSIPKVDYTKGPQGQKVERQTDDLKPLDYIEGFMDKGQPVSHGKVIEFFAKDKKKTEMWYYDGQPHGPYLSWYESGKKQWEGGYSKGEKHGKWAMYDDKTARILVDNYWLDGKVHGPSTSYHENGSKASVSYFKHDRRVGKTERWYEDGRAMSKEDALREDLEDAVADKDYERVISLLGEPKESYQRIMGKSTGMKIPHVLCVWEAKGGKHICISYLDRGKAGKAPDQLRFYLAERAKIDSAISAWK